MAAAGGVRDGGRGRQAAGQGAGLLTGAVACVYRVEVHTHRATLPQAAPAACRARHGWAQGEQGELHRCGQACRRVRRVVPRCAAAPPHSLLSRFWQSRGQVPAAMLSASCMLHPEPMAASQSTLAQAG